MKEITTLQYHTIADGYAEKCGRGPSTSASNRNSSGSSSRSNGGRGIQEAFYRTSNEGSDSGNHNAGGTSAGASRRQGGTNR